MCLNSTSPPRRADWSEEQQHAITLAMQVVAPFGFLGCVAVVVYYLSMPKHKRSTRHSLVFFLAIADMPVGIVASIGARATSMPALCQVQGVLAQTAIGGAIWSGALATHFLLGCAFLWPDERARTLLPVYHAVGWGYPLLSGIVCWATGLLGPSQPWCWISIDHKTYRFALFYFPLWAIMIYVFFVSAILTYKLTRTYVLGGVVVGGVSKMVITQILSLSLIFVLGWMPGTIYRITNAFTNSQSQFSLAMLQTILVPLQGFLNFLVYTLPMIIHQHRHKQNSLTGYPILADRSTTFDVTNNNFSVTGNLAHANQCRAQLDSDTDMGGSMKVKVVPSAASGSVCPSDRYSVDIPALGRSFVKNPTIKQPTYNCVTH